MSNEKEGVNVKIILVDIGSIQTKVTLVAKTDIWEVLDSKRVKTTIEVDDKSALNGVQEAIEELLETNELIIDEIDKFFIGSTAGGGLQMVVAGVVKNMTAESAWRAALGSGAIVVDMVSGGSAVKQPERLDQFRKAKPDIILLAGGTEGGNRNQVLGLAETINAANTKTRWGSELAAVVFAGNSEVREGVKSFLDEKIDLRIAENIRPELELEQTDNVNETIQELYMERVGKNVSGLSEIADMYKTQIKPLASSVKDLVKKISEKYEKNILMFDLGGFTTDAYSSIEYVRRAYKRSIDDGQESFRTSIGNVTERKEYTSVSANAGLNYSAPRLLSTVGVEEIQSWAKDYTAKDIYNSVFNRMINPLDEELYEDNLTRSLVANSLKVGFCEHQEIAGKLKGVGIVRNMNETFVQEASNEGTLADWYLLDDIILSGGPVKHFEDGELIQLVNDSLQPYGVTSIYVDKNDIVSQLSLFDNIDDTYLKMVEKNLPGLATIIASKPVDSVLIRNIATVEVEFENETKTYEIKKNELDFITLDSKIIKITVQPHKKVDFGAGPGKSIVREINSLQYGLILDGRRPINKEMTKDNIEKWYGHGFENVKRGEVNG
jgi:uncharacterized protein (TIGR01319 family)